MGLLVNGEWQDRWYDTASTGGRFVRKESQFRDTVPAGSTRHTPGRYRLYVSYACPWAHRTLIYRSVLGLEDAISLSVVEPLMVERGWVQMDGAPLYEIYRAAKPDYSGRVTVPVLWDEEERRIVNNESSEIIRMLDSEDLFRPAALTQEIDEMNAFIYPEVNNGVYRTGFATTQDAYEEAFEVLFAALDRIESRLATKRYLIGPTITEADWRLFTTLLRFDPVYVGHFKCNRQRIADLPQLVRVRSRSLSATGRRLDRPHGSHQDPLLRLASNHQSNGYRSRRTGPRPFSTSQPRRA